MGRTPSPSRARGRADGVCQGDRYHQSPTPTTPQPPDLGCSKPHTGPIRGGEPDLLDNRAHQLAEIDDDYAAWYVHTAAIRANHDHARTELTRRHAINPPPEDTTSTIDWLAHQAACQHAEDTYRDIHHEHELTDTTPPLDDLTPAGDQPHLEAAPRDIRELAATEPTRPAHDTVRVPTGQETADSLTHARRALAEIHQRQSAEARFAAELAHSRQLARWNDDDHTTDHHTRDYTPGLAMEAAHG